MSRPINPRWEKDCWRRVDFDSDTYFLKCPEAWTRRPMPEWPLLWVMESLRDAGMLPQNMAHHCALTMLDEPDDIQHPGTLGFSIRVSPPLSETDFEAYRRAGVLSSGSAVTHTRGPHQ